MSPFITRNVSSRSSIARSAPAVPSGSSSRWYASVIPSGTREPSAKYAMISSPRCPMQRSTWTNPQSASRWMISSSTGRSPTGTSGFGSTIVYGRRRVPRPPARITARIARRRTGRRDRGRDAHRSTRRSRRFPPRARSRGCQPVRSVISEWSDTSCMTSLSGGRNALVLLLDLQLAAEHPPDRRARGRRPRSPRPSRAAACDRSWRPARAAARKPATVSPT